MSAVLGACRSESARSGALPSTKASASDAASGPTPSAAASDVNATGDEAALQTVAVSRLAETEQGGVAVVLLHGYGAAGDDLVSLAERLARPGSRFIVPAAPLPQGSGRAWWRLDEHRPAHAWDEQLPNGFQPNAQVAAVRRAVQRLLRDVKARYAPKRLVLAGFSQGAMLSLDVALQADPPVDRVGMLSGVMLADSLAGLQAPHASKPSFFVSHGRQDTVLPYAGAEHTCQMLERHGYPVEFHPFDGTHQIPREVATALASFIYGP